MSSSEKPEIHNVLQRRQRRKQPRPQATHKKLMKLCERTDRQTDKQTDMPITILLTPPAGELITQNKL